MGGGTNHRRNLSAMVLIKDNHLDDASADVAEAVRRARRKVGRRMLVEVEVTNFGQAREAVAAGADWIMLDNMTPDGDEAGSSAWVGGPGEDRGLGQRQPGHGAEDRRTSASITSPSGR